jgi:hypothetical protein
MASLQYSEHLPSYILDMSNKLWWRYLIGTFRVAQFICILQATLVICDLTLRVFAITRFRGIKAVRKLYSNFTVTVYGGGVTAWRAHQPVTSYQYQCEREC